MKERLVMFFILVLLGGYHNKARAQADEIAQLALNIEKLSQLKSILKDLEKGYTIISQGYGTIKNISQGNFSMHELFLDGLLKVNPEVQKYYKVAGIIKYQAKLIKDYKSAYRRFQGSGSFTVTEINYIAGVYERLLAESLRNLDELVIVVTANKLRMSDDERIREIDRIYSAMEDKNAFLKDFNGKTSVLALQRQKQLAEINGLKKLNGVKQ